MMQKKFNYAVSTYIAFLALLFSVLLCYGAFILVFHQDTSVPLLFYLLLLAAFSFLYFLCRQIYRFFHLIYCQRKHQAAIIVDQSGISARGLDAQQDFSLSWQEIEHIYIDSARRCLMIRPLPAAFTKIKSKKAYLTEMIIQEMIMAESLEYIFWSILPFWQPNIEREENPPRKEKSKEVLFECLSGAVVLTLAAYLFILFF